MDDLIFGPTNCLKSGTKAGRFYAEATIKPEYRALYNGRTQERISLGSDPNKVDSKRKAEIAKANKKHRNKIAAHDPLIAAAERLIEALIVERDPVGKKLEVEDWYPRPLTREELEGLRHYTIEESLAKTEYNRLIQELRKETYKLLYAEYQELNLPDAPIIAVEQLPLEEGGTEAVPIYDPYAVNFLEAVEQQSPRFAYWRPTGSFAAAKKELEAQGKTPEEIDKWFERLYQHSGFLSSTYDAWHRRDQINDAWVAFEDEHLAKTTGRAKSGKRYSDAIKSYAEQFQTGFGQVAKRNKTFDEYTSYQRYFVEMFGDLDLADITEEHGLRIVDRLEREGKSNGTIGKYFSGIRAALRRAKHDRWIKIDPFESLEIKDRGKSKVKRKNLTPLQIRELFNLEMPEQDKMCLRLLLATGFRLEEGASLLWSDIKDEGGIQYFDLHRVNMVLKTENAARDVPVHKDLLPYLEAYKGAFTSGNRLFDYPETGKDRKVGAKASKVLLKHIHKIRAEGQTTIVTHSLRGNFITACSQSGMNDSMRRRMTGRELVGEDPRYLRFDDSLPSLNEFLQKVDISFIHGR